MTRDEDWKTVSLTANALGFAARERFERFRLEALSELVLRLVGGMMVAGATMLWLILPLGQGSEQVISHGLLAGMVTAGGLFVYAFGTRGFRRQISLDAKRKTLMLTKININEQGRVVHSVGLDRIESLFLRRPATPGGHAALCVRLVDRNVPMIALTGETSELEHVHRDLCQTIRQIRGHDRVKASPTTVKPDFARRLEALRT